jgi:hypothetical protein
MTTQQMEKQCVSEERVSVRLGHGGATKGPTGASICYSAQELSTKRRNRCSADWFAQPVQIRLADLGGKSPRFAVTGLGRQKWRGLMGGGSRARHADWRCSQTAGALGLERRAATLKVKGAPRPWAGCEVGWRVPGWSGSVPGAIRWSG